MALLTFCGFMHDLPTPIVGTGGSVVYSPRHYNAPALKLAYNGTNAVYFILYQPSGINGSYIGYASATVAISGYLRISALAACEVLALTDGAASVASLRTTAAGLLELRGVDGLVADTSTTVLALDTWYYIQLTVTIGAAGAYALSIDLTSEFTGTGNFDAVQIDDARFGVFTPAGSSALAFYWAEVSADDAAAPATGQRVLTCNPDSNGTYTEWTGGYEQVDDDPSDGDTTVATALTAGMRLTVNTTVLTLPGATTVLGTMARAVVKAESGTVADRLMYRSGSTDVQTIDANDASTSWTQVGFLRTTDPATSVAWTWAGVTAAQVGVRRASGSAGVNLICTAIWMEVLVVGVDYILPPQTGHTALAFMSDTHANAGWSLYMTHVYTCLAWMQSHGIPIRALCVAGDLNENLVIGDPFHDWIRDANGGNVDPSIDIVVAPGNWDPDEPPTSTNFGLIAENPYSAFKAAHSDLYGDNEYAYWDYGDVVRVACFNNNSDYLEADGDSAYFNCNPPGAEHALNPDHSGITDADSELRRWLETVFVGSPPRWRIAMAHRSLWAPFDSDPRKLNRAARIAMQTPMDHGLSLLVTGDIHLGSLSGPWYPVGGPVADTSALYVTPGGTGAYSLTLAGGYTVRAVDPLILPDHATTCLWSSGGVDSKKAQVAIVVFDDDGDTAQIVIFESSDADPLGSVVYDDTLTRNAAGDSVDVFGAEAALAARAMAHGLDELIGLYPMRFYPNTLPQNCTLPAICYQRIPGTRVRAMVSDTGIVRARFWLHVYGADYDDAKAVTDQVVDCFNRWQGESAGVTVLETRTDDGQDTYEEDLRQHRVIVDLEMDYLEE